VCEPAPAAHLAGMTIALKTPLDLIAQAGNTTVAQAGVPAVSQPLTVAEYDETMRQKCGDDRDLLTRSGFTSPCPAPQHLAFTAPDGRVQVTDLSADPATNPRPASVVIDLLEAREPVLTAAGTQAVSRKGEPIDRPESVMFADDATVRRVIAGFRTAADREDAERFRYICAANRLALVASMKFSVLRPVLTRLLAHRFWISKRYNHHQWQEWAAAWSGTAKIARSAGQVELLHALADLAFFHGGTKLVPDTIAGALRTAEASAWARGASSKATATHSAYRSINDFESAWTELNLADPLLHDRNALAGDIAVGKITQTLGTVKVLLDNTPRFNDGNLWLVVGGSRYKVTRDTLLAEDDNTLTMVLSVSGKWRQVVEEARQTNSTITLYPQRFNMPTALPRENNAWLNPPEKPWVRRSVPADVVLAGAPAH